MNPESNSGFLSLSAETPRWSVLPTTLRKGEVESAAMPAWWRGKLKSRTSSSSSARRKEEEAPPPEVKWSGSSPNKKEKARSFDEAAIRGNSRWPGDRSLFAFDSDREKRLHPLPPPLISLSPSRPQGPGAAAGSGSGSASVSSISSSGTDDAADVGFCRISEPVSIPKSRISMPDPHGQQHVVEERGLPSSSPVSEYEKLHDLSISPRKLFQLRSPHASSNGNGNSYCRTSVETSSSVRPRSPTNGSRGYNISTSPRHPSVFSINPGSPTGYRDDLMSSHPLPLPPGSPTSSASRALQPKWKKGKLLGKGTFGHVYMGFNSEGGQMCAIKEVKVISDDKDSNECLKQLSQEISLLSQLSHPNIVQYYGSELDEDTLAVYLEYVSGGSIYKLLREYGPFSEPVIRSYAAQILSGLAYLHGRETVHRDIKGANILVDPKGVVKLADFGMAKHIATHNSIHSFKGSPYWMAPEVIMTTSGYNLSVDIWSFGCTIIEMATSKPPWCQYEGVAAIFKIVNSKDIPEIPSHLSREGKDFLRLCLQRDPSARPTAAQLMDHPFVRDQATAKFGRTNLARELPHSPSDGTQTPPGAELCYQRSASPLSERACPLRHTLGSFPVTKSPSDLVNSRMNLSLPVSPCSSPLRSFRQPNWSCLPSPPHPSFPGGTLGGGGGFSSYSVSPVGAGRSFLDPWVDVSRGRSQSPYESPRR